VTWPELSSLVRFILLDFMQQDIRSYRFNYIIIRTGFISGKHIFFFNLSKEKKWDFLFSFLICGKFQTMAWAS